MTIEGGDDPVRDYTETELACLTAQLSSLTESVHSGAYSSASFDLPMLCLLHRELFRGVRDHAGRHRRKDHGSEYLVFGPNRSLSRDQVDGELTAVFDKLRRSLRSFEENPEAEQYDEHAIHVAVWVHAEVIRVHPFEDGNGRCSRLLMNTVLVKLGLRPVAMEACKQEYFDCLNTYFTQRTLTPLRDLVLRVYAL